MRTRFLLVVVLLSLFGGLASSCMLLDSPPVATFTAIPGGGVAPLLVSFDGSASSDSDGSIVGYEWDFGDGNKGTGQSTQHTYSSMGAYDVRLTVRDDAGWDNFSDSTVYVANSVPYDDLFRNNDAYKGDVIYLRGKIIQVHEPLLGGYDWRVATGQSQYLGYIDDVVWANYSGPRFLEGDIVELCGEVVGLKTYTAVLGQQVTIPEVDVLWVELYE